MELEGFLKHLKRAYNPIWGPCPIPDVVTRENVNQSYESIYENRTLLELAFDDFSTFKSVIPILLSLGATIKCRCLFNKDTATYFLDLGTNPNMPFNSSMTPFNLFETYVLFATDISLGNILIDYGGKPIGGWSRFIGQNQQATFSTRIINYRRYATLSNRRVQECRKALLAILFACNISSFRPVVEILLSAARQTWAMRGGEGCGPRGWLWVSIPKGNQ